MPTYGNTHSSGSACGIQTTFFFRESRQLIKDAVGGSDKDAVLFIGSGCTAAISKMVAILGLHRSEKSLDKTLQCPFPGCRLNFIDQGSFKVYCPPYIFVKKNCL